MTPELIVNLVLVALAVVWLLARQLAWRPVSERSVLPLIFVAIGLFQAVRLAGETPVPALDWVLLGASILLGAGLAAWRALTVELRDQDGTAWSRGTWFTSLLWLVSVAQHLVMGLFIQTAHLGEVTLLGYLGIVLWVQRELVLRRVQRAGLAPRTRAERDRGRERGRERHRI